ncbi:MAG: deoxyribose-phosphate aldolase [Lachnospiraceae bacterium]|nr:deoxyribose-phosphate aldolase [Lachnospiraceae bacterium]
MDLKEILRHVDHTLLAQDAAWEQIQQICDDAVNFGTASVCIPPAYVKQASEYLQGKTAALQDKAAASEENTTALQKETSALQDKAAAQKGKTSAGGTAAEGDACTRSVPAVCTVIGFPNGYNTTAVKEFETKDAIENGANEIDMVINIGWVKDQKYDCIRDEIRTLKAACGDKILKVIIETCLLTEEEKIRLCEIVTEAGADFIKTSTGFSKGGATFADVALFAEHVGSDVKIKAAGGISSLEDAAHFLELGASRLGTSRIVKIAKQQPVH